MLEMQSPPQVDSSTVAVALGQPDAAVIQVRAGAAIVEAMERCRIDRGELVGRLGWDAHALDELLDGSRKADLRTLTRIGIACGVCFQLTWGKDWAWHVEVLGLHDARGPREVRIEDSAGCQKGRTEQGMNEGGRSRWAG